VGRDSSVVVSLTWGCSSCLNRFLIVSNIPMDVVDNDGLNAFWEGIINGMNVIGVEGFGKKG